MNPELKDALDEINQARRYFHLKPLAALPKGRRDEPCDCPVYNAIEEVLAVSAREIVCSTVEEAQELAAAWQTELITHPHFAWGTVVKTPKKLATFIGRFDNGEYPELEAA